VNPPTPLARRATRLFRLLGAAHPDAGTTLDHRNPFELLVATVLSAQTTDARVNRVTPELFRRFPEPETLSRAGAGEIEEVIRSIGFYNAKARALRGLGHLLVGRFGGEVPSTLEELIQLPGVGRKTANVVLGNAFGRAEGVVVDTHVGRLARRLGLTRKSDPAKVERELSTLFPRKDWVRLAHRLILHGRSFCRARRPSCLDCPLLAECPRTGLPPLPSDDPKPTGRQPTGGRSTPRRKSGAAGQREVS
jgi:endonuclease-3